MDWDIPLFLLPYVCRETSGSKMCLLLSTLGRREEKGQTLKSAAGSSKSFENSKHFMKIKKNRLESEKHFQMIYSLLSSRIYSKFSKSVFLEEHQKLFKTTCMAITFQHSDKSNSDDWEYYSN